MGEHSKPQPQYEEFDRPLRSPVPELDLSERDVEDVMSDEFSDASYLMNESDPDKYPGGVLDANQLEWELNLLPGQDLERALEFSTALFQAGLQGDEYATRIGANVLSRSIEVDEGDAALGLVKKSLQYEQVAEVVSRTIAHAIESGIISSDKAAKVVAALMDQLRAVHQKAQALGQLAKRGVTIANVKGDVVIGDDTTHTQSFHYGTDRKG
ncbi:hypothetical protein [Nocardia farcinica]